MDRGGDPGRLPRCPHLQPDFHVGVKFADMFFDLFPPRFSHHQLFHPCDLTATSFFQRHPNATNKNPKTSRWRARLASARLSLHIKTLNCASQREGARSNPPPRSGACFYRRLRNRLRPDSDQLMLKQNTHRSH